MDTVNRQPVHTGLEIAVIGIAGRFPGASHPEEFWENLQNGTEAICFFSAEELAAAGIAPGTIDDPAYIKAAGGILENKAYFDAAFFDYTPLESRYLDPQIRVLHECAWEALEDGGYDPFSFEDLIGLYAGASDTFSWEATALMAGENGESTTGGFERSLLTNRDFGATRTSYKLNLKGPVVSVQTACSTSLVAVHMACRALLTGECEMALAGGVSISNAARSGYFYQEGMIISPDGHCRAFAAEARGTIAGEGAGIVLLKRLAAANSAHDHIRAVIKGSAINNDGNRKPGYTAPSVEGQLEVITRAMHLAAVEPESITYVETHGTGTPLGDPVEIEALKLAFHTEAKGFCAVGSLKTNVGHMNSAAGIGSLIKTILALQHRRIPPSLHFNTPNPGIDFENSPFYVNTRLLEWENKGGPLRAGVSSFGIGGTNAHMIVEEAPGISTPPQQREQENESLILLSAKTPAALAQMTHNLAGYLRKNPHTALTDLAYTLQVGRAAFPHRQSLVSAAVPQAIKKLEASHRGFSGTAPAGKKTPPPPVIFMFPGLGSQYVGMGRELYRKVEGFREELDRCFALLKSLSGEDLKEILYPDLQAGADPGLNSQKIHQPGIAQQSVFIVEYALARLLMKVGIHPHAMIGYSLGEYTAACLAGVLSLEDALALVVRRGELVEGLPEGAMLGVPLPETRLRPLLDSSLAIALDNGPSCVVAGPPAAVADFAKKLKGMKYLCMPVPAVRALHSPMMDPILEELERNVESLTLNKPGIPYISNVTGNWLTAGEATSPRYWARHLRETVRFGEGLKGLAEIPGAILVEVGPGSDLCALAGRRDNSVPAAKVTDLVPKAHRKQGDYAYLLHKIGRLWTWGLNLDWEQFHPREKPHRIPLPTYPFARERFWLRGDPLALAARERENRGQRETPPKTDFHQWFYVPQWKRSLLPGGPSPQNQIPRRWLLLVDDSPFSASLLEQMRAKAHTRDLVLVRAGKTFSNKGGREYTLHPRQPGDYLALGQALGKAGWVPQKIVHLWNIGPPPPGALSRQQVEEAQYNGFYSLLFLARTLGRQGWTEEIHLEVVTAHLQEVNGAEALGPERAPLLGAMKVLPQEYPNLRCRCIDIGLSGSGPVNREELAAELLQELQAPPLDPVVALRGPHRWVEIFEPFDLEERAGNPAVLRERGVYLVTGGLGDIGLELAHYLARTVSARLILTSRAGLPPRHQWPQWVSGRERTDPAVRKIEKIQAMEALGGQVLAVDADVSDYHRMKAVVAAAEKEWGPISGVIHAAGLIRGDSFQLAQEISESQCREQFVPKIDGLLVLEDLFRDRAVDFFWVISSIAAVLGGLKFAAYAAANAFMDHFVQYRNRSHPGKRRWISANWDGMDTAATEKAFQRIVGLQKPDRLVVSSNGDLQRRLDRWVRLESLHRDPPIGDTGLQRDSRRPRPELITEYLAPGNSTAAALARIWQTALGFELIGVEDDFLELGGDSLKAITVLGKIQKDLEVQLTLKDFLNRPTIREQAQYIDSLAGKSDSPTEIPAAALEKKEYYALSSAQMRLYILQQMNPGGIAYNQFQAILLEGDCNKEKLAGVFRGLIARHEILRTSFFLLGGEPVQAVREAVDFRLNCFAVTAQADDAPAVAKIIADFVTPFDLARPPLFRVGLVERRDHRHVLLLDLHHLIIDGVSFGIFREEFMALYEGKPLPPSLLQYKDYAEWQRGETGQEAREQHRDYWLREFSAGAPVLALPCDYTRPRNQSFAGAAIGFELGVTETRALKAIARQHDATLFMLMAAIFSLFLSRLSGQEDIVIGTPSAGRHQPQLESLLGVFVNMLALRSYPVGEKRFHSFFQETRQRILDAFAHAGYPYEELVEQVTLARDMSRNPLFDVMFDWQGFDFPAVEAPGLKMTPFPHRGKIAKYDLTLQAFLSGETLTCIFAYCSELFKPETLARWVDYFRETVAAVLEDLHREIATVELISKEEKTRILESCNGIRLDFPQAKPLHRLFAEQASRTPHRVAAAEAEAILSYGQLHRETRQAARLLKERGVKPGTVVGIGVERSLEMLIGIFAILEAGAAYLPLPPSLPLGRSKWVIKESALGFLLTSAPVIPGAAPGRDGRDLEIIVLEERHGRDSTGEQRESEAAGSGHELAYVIYTSGSTGTPKGVMVEHGSVVNRLNWMQWAYPLGAADTVIQKTPITFDVSVWELFWWFLGGASLFLLEAGAEANPDALIRAIAKNPNTTMHFVPSMLNVFLEYIEGNSASHRLAGLKQLFSSGEALSPGLAEKFNRLPGVERGVRLVNLYGPTEATVDVSYFNVPGERELALIPIGKPIANIALLIVDGHLNLQPVGIAGELLIAGVGVARGYMNNPELTVERFCRLRQKTYRTGDLARRLPDGNIEFLGRMDRQVKIRGIRIEPAEIEKGLLSHDNISAAVVLEKHDNNDSELCAYIVTRGEAEVPGLKAYLAEFLPEAMIPAVFVRIRQIPLKPNGKLDREALERGGARLPSGVAYTAPENPIERTVALLWSEVLKIQEIGVEEIFFNIGGNSLKLIRLFGRLKEVYPEAVEIQDLFDYPTIRRLARRIAAKIAPTPLSPREQRRKVEF